MARIIVADDDREVRELIIFALRFAGHKVIGAQNGKEVIQLAHQLKPDLILMDVRMPIMNGYEACKTIKAENETKSIPVIFLSARGQEAEIQAGLSAGGDDYILKPISPDQLTKKVGLFLQKAIK
jgi:CheY-like chemotaxis protein